MLTRHGIMISDTMCVNPMLFPRLNMWVLISHEIGLKPKSHICSHLTDGLWIWPLLAWQLCSAPKCNYRMTEKLRKNNNFYTIFSNFFCGNQSHTFAAIWCCGFGHFGEAATMHQIGGLRRKSVCTKTTWPARVELAELIINLKYENRMLWLIRGKG